MYATLHSRASHRPWCSLAVAHGYRDPTKRVSSCSSGSGPEETLPGCVSKRNSTAAHADIRQDLSHSKRFKLSELEIIIHEVFVKSNFESREKTRPKTRKHDTSMTLVVCIPRFCSSTPCSTPFRSHQRHHTSLADFLREVCSSSCQGHTSLHMKFCQTLSNILSQSA